MTGQLIPALVYKDWTSNGTPLAFGFVFTYAAGTQVQQATYTDSTLNTPNTNPVQLNARGEANIWLDPQLVYKFVVQDSIGNIIRTVDQVAGPLGGSNLGNLIPAVTNTFNLGSSTSSWANLFLGPNGSPVFDTSSGNVGYYALNFNETAALVTDYAYTWGDVRRYGAMSGGTPSYSAPLVAGPGGQGDTSVAVRNALTGIGFALFPPGDWRLDSTIALNGTAILMQAGAVITRYSATSSATTPMFWCQGPNCAIIGQGIASQIVTQNAAPSGIILNGCASMTSASPLGLDVVYNTFQNFKMVGQQAYGQSAGTPDVCFFQINPQLDGKAVYFAFMNNLVANSANFGYWLQGDANANLMSNLHGYWIGNVTRALPSAQGADALVFSQGALDYSLSGLFHHFSPSTTSLRIEDYDNTATSGGAYHQTSYCDIGNFICEQGNAAGPAPAAKAVIANTFCSAFANKITVNDNASGGNDISSYFYFNNETNLVSGGPSFPNLRAVQNLNVGNTVGGTFQGTVTNGSATITAITPLQAIFPTGMVPSDLKVGCVVTGTGIPANTTIITKGVSTLTMSANATVAATGTTTTISYTDPPGTLFIGTGRQMQFITYGVPDTAATTIVPTGNLIVPTGAVFVVHISASHTGANGNSSRTDFVPVNLANSAVVASTVGAKIACYASSGNAYDPSAAAYTISVSSPATPAAPALQVAITPVSSTGYTYTVVVQLLSTG